MSLKRNKTFDVKKVAKTRQQFLLDKARVEYARAVPDAPVVPEKRTVEPPPEVKASRPVSPSRGKGKQGKGRKGGKGGKGDKGGKGARQGGKGSKGDEPPTKRPKVQCFKCWEWGHYQTECPNAPSS